MNPVTLLIGSFLLLVFVGVRIPFALGLASLITFLELGLPPLSVINQMFAGINSFPLLAVPFFLFLGRLMNEGGITDRLLDVADAVVGHIRGGLGHINVMVSMMFASLSGSAAADTASIGSILIPAMKKAGYHTPYAVAVTAASSTLGIIIPPSITMVIYGAFGNVSIGALFLGGIVPGLMIGLSMMLYTYLLALRHGYPANPRRSLLDMGRAIVRALPPLFIPIIILGGITGGVFTATEAAAIAVVLGLVLALGVYRLVRVRDLPDLLAEAVVAYSLPMFAVATAGIMGWLIAYLGLGEDVARFILSVTEQPLGIYLMLVAFFVVIGMFMSPVVAILIFLPVVQSLGAFAGFNQIHLGLIIILTLALGLITPPYGICLLIASQIGEISPLRAFVAVMPMVLMTIAIIILGILIPDLFLFLPKAFLPEAFPAGRP